MIGAQTWTLAVDAYRELNAKKLFWVTLALTVLVVAVLGMLGINDEGVTFLVWTLPGFGEFASRVEPGLFYKFIMKAFGIDVWLTWVAAILALISTAGIFPDLVSSGSIETALSKPIGRARLFLTKYLMGLLFVVLQVGVFAAGMFLILGLRGGEWEWSVWLAVPIVVLFFSYLYAVCVLLGVLTRSAIAALLLTLLAWFGLFGVNAAEGVVLTLWSQQSYQVERSEAQAALSERAAAALREEIGLEPDERATEIDPDGERAEGLDTLDLRRLRRLESGIEAQEAAAAEARESLESIEPWRERIFLAKTVLPKTGETIGLLDRFLFDVEELRLFLPPGAAGPSGGSMAGNEDVEEELARYEEAAREAEAEGGVVAPTDVLPPPLRVERELRSRSVAWVIGTSVLFEALVIGLALWLFNRRDF